MKFIVIKIPRFLAFIINKIIWLFGGRKEKKAY